MNKELIINDVDQSAKFYFLEKPWRRIFLPIILVIVWEWFCFLLFKKYQNLLEDGTIIIFIPVIIGAIYYRYVIRTFRSKFFKQFAKENGFIFKKSGSVDEREGFIFGLGHSKAVTNVVEGNYIGYPMKLFNYTYITGSGKSRREHNFTIFELKINTSLPRIILKSKSLSFDSFDLINLFKFEPKHIKLEPEFDKYFDLTAPDGYEMEALQIFSPDFLNYLIKEAEEICLDLSMDTVNIYDDRFIDTREELVKMFNISKEITHKLGPLLKRLKDDFEVLHPYYQGNL